MKVEYFGVKQFLKLKCGAGGRRMLGLPPALDYVLVVGWWGVEAVRASPDY